MPAQPSRAEVAGFPRFPVDITLTAPSVGYFGPELDLDEDNVTDARRQSRLIDVPNEALTAEQIFRNELVVLIPSLRSFALRLCGNRDMADDLSQDAMMRGWAARSRYQPGTNLRAWLFAILRNQMYSNFRKARQSTALDDHGMAELVLVQAPAQQHAIHLADAAKALLKLPWNQRQVLELVGAGGQSYEEAALIVGCPMGTLKGRLWRGRKALASMIDGPGDAILFDEFVPQDEASDEMPTLRNLQ